MSRDPQGGVEAQTIVKRELDYGAPVCSHFGHNIYTSPHGKPCAAYGGCTLCDPSKIQYIDELDDVANVHKRLETPRAKQAAGLVRPEVEWAGDGGVCVTLFVPEEPRLAEAAALHLAEKMGLQQPSVQLLRTIALVSPGRAIHADMETYGRSGQKERDTSDCACVPFPLGL